MAGKGDPGSPNATSFKWRSRSRAGLVQDQVGVSYLFLKFCHLFAQFSDFLLELVVFRLKL